MFQMLYNSFFFFFYSRKGSRSAACIRFFSVFPHYTVVSFFQGPVRIFPVLSDVYRRPSCKFPFRIPF